MEGTDSFEDDGWSDRLHQEPPPPAPRHPEPAKEKLWTNTKVQNARNGGRRTSASVFGKLEIRILNQKLAPCFHSTELSVRTSQGRGWGRQSGLKGQARGRPQPLRRCPWAASSVLMNVLKYQRGKSAQMPRRVLKGSSRWDFLG